MRLVRTRLIVALAVALALAIAPARGSAQTTVTATYTASSPASPTATNIANGFFVVGSMSVQMGACGKSTCDVWIRGAATVNANLRYTVGSPPVNAVACVAGASLTAGTLGPKLINSSSAPATVTLYFCYAGLSWTTAAGTLSPVHQVDLLLTQN